MISVSETGDGAVHLAGGQYTPTAHTSSTLVALAPVKLVVSGAGIDTFRHLPPFQRNDTMFANPQPSFRAPKASASGATASTPVTVDQCLPFQCRTSGAILLRDGIARPAAQASVADTTSMLLST